MISKNRDFYSYNYYSIPRFLHGQIVFHLDNSDPNPVERKMISNPIQIQRNPNIRPDCTLKSGSCTPLIFCHITRAFRVFCFNARISRTLQKVQRRVFSVEHDPVPDRDPTGFCNSEPDPDWTGFWKYLYRIGYPNCVDHCSRMLRVFFGYQADCIKYLDIATGVKRNFWPLRNFWLEIVSQLFYFSE